VRPPAAPDPVRWLSRRAVALHAASAGVVGGCAFAFWWQLHRALDGNELSWAYTFEWPLFAGITAVIWWQQVHESPERIARRHRRSTEGRDPEPSNDAPRWDAGADDPEMAAYNRYLAGLAGRRKSWRSS